MTHIESAAADDLESCLSILRQASTSDPFVQWLEEANSLFQALQLFWRWLRLRVLFPVERWSVMREISKNVANHESSNGLFIWYFGVGPDHRTGRVARQMLANVLGNDTGIQTSPCVDRPIFLHTARPQLTHLLRTAGAEELRQIMLSEDRPPLTFFKSEGRQLAAAVA